MTTLCCWTDSETETGDAYGKPLPCYPGAVHRAKGKGPVVLCTSSALHAYRSPELAVLMDPVHRGRAEVSVLWRITGRIMADDGGKLGLRTRTLREIIDPPTVTLQQRIRFAVLAARSVVNPDLCAEWWKWTDQVMADADFHQPSAAHDAHVARVASRSAFAAYSSAASAAYSRAAYVAVYLTASAVRDAAYMAAGAAHLAYAASGDDYAASLAANAARNVRDVLNAASNPGPATVVSGYLDLAAIAEEAMRD